jgi:DNA-binding NtrC family response regulator
MVLIVDDEKPTRDGLRAALEDRYDVYVAEDAATAMSLLEQEHFAVLLTDLRLPKEDGLKLIARAKSLPKPPVCILMTAYGSEDVAVEAMKRGADDYIAKGKMQIDELEMRIARALKGQKLEEENKNLHQRRAPHRRVGGDAGNSGHHSNGRAQPRHRAHHRRERHRQGGRREDHSSTQPAREGPAHHGPRGRFVSVTAGERAVRA